jgi:hypothetical protein
MGGTQVHLAILGYGCIDNSDLSSFLSRNANKLVYAPALNRGKDRRLPQLGKSLFGESLYISQLLLGHEYIGIWVL